MFHYASLAVGAGERLTPSPVEISVVERGRLVVSGYAQPLTKRPAGRELPLHS
jgi:hypothetical protein